MTIRSAKSRGPFVGLASGSGGSANAGWQRWLNNQMGNMLLGDSMDSNTTVNGFTFEGRDVDAANPDEEVYGIFTPHPDYQSGTVNISMGFLETANASAGDIEFSYGFDMNTDDQDLINYSIIGSFTITSDGTLNKWYTHRLTGVTPTDDPDPTSIPRFILRRTDSLNSTITVCQLAWDYAVV